MAEYASIENKSEQASAQATVSPETEMQNQDIDLNLLQGIPIQRKLVVGSTDDPLEDEADAMADKVTNMPEQSFVQRKCAHCEEEEQLQRRPSIPFIQRKETEGGSAASESIGNKIESSKGVGAVLPPSTKSFMESRFGADFTDVRIHTGSDATEMSGELNAQAFTVANDIYFNSSKFSPETSDGKNLLAHELTHAIQQRDTTDRRVQKRDLDAEPAPAPVPDSPVGGGLPVTAATPPGSRTTDTGSFTQEIPDVSQGVIRIVVSCTSMLLRLDTATGSHVYQMDSCSVPEGAYETNVTVSGNNFSLSPQVPGQPPGGFRFRYRIRAGQTNPASLLRGQRTVHVDVVPNMVAPEVAPQPAPDARRQRPGCLLSLPDQELIPRASASRSLFNPLRFDRTLWRHPVPLGCYGWVDLNANASGQLTGNIIGSYGPGMLRNICLTYEQERVDSSAPIEHPLLPDGSHADVTTTTLRGFADFNMPARAVLRLLASGLLRISGDYLSVISLAAAEGRLTALAEGSTIGSINGRVEITTTATRSITSFPHPLLPLSLDLSNTTFTPVDLVAEIGMQGRAGLLFRVDLSAGFEILGNNLWSQSWNLVNFNPSISWAGGIRYRSGSGVEWNLGKMGRNDTLDAPGQVSTFNTTSSDVDEENIIDSILDEHQAVISAPDGLTEATALPFIWYKPISLYPRALDIPNADDPHRVMRDDGPQEVRYTQGSRSVYELIGVAEWPAVRRTFDYMPYDSRSEPEKDRFVRLMNTLGYVRSGLDIDHVWDIGLRGLDYDRFDNLWPASNHEQQLAGGRHNRQIRDYRSTIGNINGRWFIIVDVRHPA